MKTNKVKITESKANPFQGQLANDIEEPLSEEEMENVAGGMMGPQAGNIDSRVHSSESDQKKEPHPINKGVMGF